jgi:hypothetical protein
MSQSNNPGVNIGCPACSDTVTATVPPAPGVADRSQLRGTEARCRNCGHELELYYY